MSFSERAARRDDDRLPGLGDLLDEHPVVDVGAGELDDLACRARRRGRPTPRRTASPSGCSRCLPDRLDQRRRSRRLRHLRVERLLDVADVGAVPEVLVDEAVDVAELQLDRRAHVVEANDACEKSAMIFIPRSRLPQWLLASSRTNRSSKMSRLIMGKVAGTRATGAGASGPRERIHHEIEGVETVQSKQQIISGC